MAMRTMNLLGQQAAHRAPALSICPFSVIERNGVAPVGWRSSCGAPVGSCRPAQQQFPARCAAMAPPRSPAAWSIDTGCEDVMGQLRETEKLKNCLGAPLTDDEQRSLIKCLDSARLGVDTCLVDGLPALRDHLMSYIEAVSVSQTDDLELVEGAMLLIEQLSLALELSLSLGGSAASPSWGTAAAPAGSSPAVSELPGGEGPSGRFSGQWQVLVTSGGGWPYGRLQYVPIIEVLDISEDGQHFRFESKVGPLYMTASGEVTWRRQPVHLGFHVTELRVEMFGAAVSLPPPVVPDNDLLLFAMSGSSTTALARTSAGGMQLMGRPA